MAGGSLAAPWAYSLQFTVPTAAPLFRDSSRAIQFALTKCMIFARLCHHHLSLKPECFITPKRSPVPISTPSLLPPGPWKPIRVLDTAYKWGAAVYGLSCLLGRLSLRRMLSGLRCVGVSASFLFLDECYSIVGADPSVFIH